MTKVPSTGEDAVSFDSVLAGISARSRRISLCLRGDLLSEIERLDEALARARLADEMHNREPEAPKLAQRVVELTEEAQAAEVEFVFEPMGRRPWRDLIAEHPPTKEQKATGADFNLDTFPIAAMAACCIAPKGATAEKFRQLADDPRINDEQWNRLWITCHSANTGGNGGADIPLSGTAFAVARGTGTSSASLATTGSPGPSS